MTRGTVPDPFDVATRLRASNNLLRRELQHATDNSDRAFWRGAIFGGILIGGIFIAAHVMT